MKLWHSFTKEILLATRSFYFYIEVIMAGVFLFLLFFVIPENFESRRDEYLYFDVPASAYEVFEREMLLDDTDGVIEKVEFERDDEIHIAQLFQSEGKNNYVFDDPDVAIAFADEDRSFAAIISMDDAGEVTYTYYMQGYETDRLINTYAVFHNESLEVLADVFDAQEVRALKEGQVSLTDRQNMIPSFLTFNGSLMGMFLIAAYIFLDKKEGVIKAYAVTTSSVWQYLLSKVGMVTTTSLVTSLIIVVPVMGAQPNYWVMFIFLLTSGFAASALGLVVASFYDDLVQAFGAIFVLIIAMMLPNIAYFIPTWSPNWIQYIPSYALLEGFKENLLLDGDITYLWVTSGWFLLGGLVLFIFANFRFKKTLTV